MAMEKNKVKFGLNKVHYAKITAYDEEGEPTFLQSRSHSRCSVAVY